MQKFLSRFALLVTAAGLSVAVASCSDDDDKVIAPNMEPPTFNITVSEVQRTQADFSISSAEAADYAYIVAEPNESYMPTAEELFTDGTIGQFEKGVA